MNAIEIENLSKSYPGFKLDGLSLTLPAGAIMGLVGENGAGKSTAIRLILNAARRDGGTVRVLGTDNESPEFSALKEDIGVVLDEAYFPEVLTARNIGAVLAHTYKNWNADVYGDYLRHFELPERKPFKDFSRGMKMKLALAAALSHAPKLLILDEATSGLDPFVRDEMLDILNDFTRDERHSVLISSHIVSDLEKICDYIAFIHRGRLLFCKEKDRLLEEYAVVRLRKSELANLPKEAVLGCRTAEYGAEALMRRENVPAGAQTQRAGIEEIILLMVKGGDAR